MLILVVLICSCGIFAHANNSSNFIDYYGPVEETQHTYCKIDTEEIKASANATITRQLRGVSTSKELKKAVTIILNEINTLKETLSTKNRSKRLSHQDFSWRNYAEAQPEMEEEEEFSPNMVTISQDGHEYAFYWAIQNATHYLSLATTLISPNFICKGSVYYLKMNPLLKHAKMQLQSVTKFNNFYKIILMDKQGLQEDISSPLLNAKSTYRLSMRKLFNYTANNDGMLLIKLLIYV